MLVYSAFRGILLPSLRRCLAFQLAVASTTTQRCTPLLSHVQALIRPWLIHRLVFVLELLSVSAVSFLSPALQPLYNRELTMTAIVRSLRPRSFVPRVGFHTAAVSLVRDPVASAGMRSPGVPSTNQAGSAAGQSATGTASAAAAGQGRERTDAGPSAVSGSRSHRSGDRSTALSAADSGERERQERGGGGLLPFGQQFPSLTSLLPSPLRSLFSRGGRDRDVFGDMFRDPFFSPLLPLSPVLPLTTGTTAAAPVVSRGVWDVDAELANPIQGVELDETDDAYAMKTKLSPAINKKVSMHPARSRRARPVPAVFSTL